MTEADRLLSIRDAAEILQRSTKSLRNYVKAGKLQAEKVPGPKGPQFVFRAAEVERFAQELRLDVAEQLGASVAVSKASPGGPGVPMQVPANLPALIEAFLNAERERTRLLEEIAAERAETSRTMGTLEERVTQLQQRLKREEKFSERTKDLEKELRAWKRRVESRDEKLRLFEEERAVRERRAWWQFWRAPEASDRLDDE